LTQGIDFNSALSMVLETSMQAWVYRVVIFFRDAGLFKAKVGFGNRMPEACRIHFPEAYEPIVSLSWRTKPMHSSGYYLKQGGIQYTIAEEKLCQM